MQFLRTVLHRSFEVDDGVKVRHNILADWIARSILKSSSYDIVRMFCLFERGDPLWQNISFLSMMMHCSGEAWLLTSSSAGSAEEAWMAARVNPPDLVLLDINLPGMDGLDALRIFQNEFHVPVIFLTARRRELEEALGMEPGWQ
jgi:CheY-like chemotaxis protein